MKYDIEETKTPLYFIPSYVDAYIFGLRKNFGLGVNWHLMEFDNKIGRFIVKIDELNRVGLRIIEYFSKQKNKEIVEANFHRIEKLWGKIFKQMDNSTKLSNEELFEVYRESKERFCEMLSWTLICEALDHTIENILTKKVSAKYLPDLIASSSPSFIKREEEELLTSKDLGKHAQKYFWIHGSHWEVKPLPVSYFEKRKKELEKKIYKKHDVKEILSEKKSVLEKINADKELRFLIELNDFSNKLHDERKAWFLKSVYYYRKLLKEIGRRYGYKLDEMLWFMPDEIMGLKDGEKMSHEILHEREKYMVLLSDPNHKVYIKEKAKELIAKIFNNTDEKKDYTKGVPASLGLAKGTAKVLSTPKDVGFKKGDILITSMTRPDFVPLMRLASAIVTDEGGLTCHAAIISRELGIPCVIGTKNATKIFKSGDMIEVNANKGIVRKI